MKVEPASISREWIRTLLIEQYGLQPTGIEFWPHGEESFSYRVAAPDGTEWFLRVQAGAPHLEAAYRSLQQLARQAAMPAIVGPCPTLEGRASVTVGHWFVSLFPWCHGRTLWDFQKTGAMPPHWVVRTAGLISALHGQMPDGVELQCERFGNPFRERIERLIDRSLASRAVRPGSCRQEMLSLVGSNRRALLNALELLDHLGGQARHKLRESRSEVITHGDPNLDNLIVGKCGELYLVDCGDLALGPRERDLFHYTGEGFRSFLNAYRCWSDEISLDPGLFEYYFLRWDLQEVADYGSRLLDEELPAEEKENAWTELTRYLPLREDELRDGVDAVQEAIEQTGRERPGRERPGTNVEPKR